MAIAVSMNAQTLVKENKLWACTMAGSEQPENYESYYIKFSGDTIVNGIEYKIAWKCQDSLQINWEIETFIREDSTKKVYFINPRTNEEELIYDFGLEEGDTIWSNTGQFYARVESVSYIHLDNFDDSLKKIVVESEYYAWIEGIGSMNGILQGLNIIHLVGAYFDLTCYFENDTLKFQNPEFSTCFPKGFNDTIYEYNGESIQITPFISGNNLILELQEIPSSNSALQIFNCLGSLVYEEQFMNDNRLEIPTQEFQKGIYIYRLEIDKSIFSGKVVIP